MADGATSVPTRSTPRTDEATAQLRARELHGNDRTCRSLGIELDVAGPGHATVRMLVTETMTNGFGMAHGGYLFLLADAAFSFACNTHGPTTVAQGAQVTFLRPAAVGDELWAEAVERSRFGRAGLYDVTVRRADGTVIAEFRGHSQMISGRPGTA
ncbi:hydroxyphenylacetyl-CoA thioesterase PaaI [Solwaraspora sp. WMMD406]|uniref:hydroxyphenylacetyl-CoA thioesterase PaaI n=1 Tax=Solwaraspora sp. WMMD406 TaxID=3016095 RepID=UPI002416645A|nr:hydroxyphenylacetyl-CoA thioesterase PaaI [Solwaraspora sp. WMMD406]MDG4765027.1 hydroxyphenylacetyl-CoA thioesterase PaaI [Solwaraspora sp. WMMD406]